MKAAYDSLCKVETMEGCCLSVQAVLKQSNLKFRPEKKRDNLDKFNPRLLDLKKSLQI